MSELNVHALKTWQQPFRQTKDGNKTAEFRKNDRGFKAGDILVLREWNQELMYYTNNEIAVKVQHVMQGLYGIPDGYCVMSVERI